jgi:ATP/maltotriose-dependent transcriptional regulator MalT
LNARLAGSGAPVTLILDDYHRASAQPLDGFLGQWIALLPEGTRLLMSTRRRPDIGLHRLLGSGAAVEITSDMLRFTPSESRQVLDVGLAEADRDALAERTEGWPVALQLARLITLQGQGRPLRCARSGPAGNAGRALVELPFRSGPARADRGGGRFSAGNLDPRTVQRGDHRCAAGA